MNKAIPWGLEVKEAFVVSKETYKAKKIQSLMSLYSGSRYTLDYTGDDIESFQANLEKYISENQLENLVSAQREGTSFAFDIKAGNKKANMMVLYDLSPKGPATIEWE